MAAAGHTAPVGSGPGAARRTEAYARCARRWRGPLASPSRTLAKPHRGEHRPRVAFQPRAPSAFPAPGMPRASHSVHPSLLVRGRSLLTLPDRVTMMARFGAFPQETAGG